MQKIIDKIAEIIAYNRNMIQNNRQSMQALKLEIDALEADTNDLKTALDILRAQS